MSDLENAVPVVKATIRACATYITILALAFGFVWWEMGSQSWGADDSGAVQGIALSALASAIALPVIAISFPGVACFLGNRFSIKKWLLINVILLALVCSIALAALAYLMGGLGSSISFPDLFALVPILLVGGMTYRRRQRMCGFISL